MSRYAAFISYSHADSAVARWLHHKVETYRLPRALVGTESPFGPVPRRLPPLFRDRDELPASGDLGTELRAALAESRFQVVLCSPRAAQSHWVNEEILSFKRLHGEHRTLALIVAGEPYAGGDLECFPPALRYRLGPDGTLSDVPAEPIAADIRSGKDGRRLARLKIIAGLAGVPLDALARRDAARRQRRLMWVTAASLAIAMLTIGLAIYAEGQRRTAERQRRLADRSLDFLIGTFEIANPATENPRTITALTILDRASRRARTELGNEPAVGARLLRATGDIYLNLGLQNEAERDMQAALARLPAVGAERAYTQLRLGVIADRRGDVRAMTAAIDAAGRAAPKRGVEAAALQAHIAEQRGMAARLASKPAEAAALLGEAASLYAALEGQQRRPLARVWMNQAQELLALRRFDEADAIMARTVALYTARFGTNHVSTANAIQNRALADFERGRLPQAAQGIDRAVAIYQRVLDADHPTIGAALILTGRIRTAEGDAVGALAAFDRARGLHARLYGAQNPAVGDVDFYAAQAEAVAGRTDAALVRLARTKRIYDAAYGPLDPDQVELLLARSRILDAGGRHAAARRDCAAGVALQVRLDPEDPSLPDVRDYCRDLGENMSRP